MNEPDYISEQDRAATETLKSYLRPTTTQHKQPTGKRLVTARLSVGAAQGLQVIAARLGYTWNSRGNVSLLLEAIGNGSVVVIPAPRQ